MCAGCPRVHRDVARLQAVSAIRLGLANARWRRRAGRWPLVCWPAAACVVAFLVLGTGSPVRQSRDSAGARKRYRPTSGRCRRTHLLDIATRDVQTVQAWFAGGWFPAPGVAPPAAFEPTGGDWTTSTAIAWRRTSTLSGSHRQSVHLAGRAGRERRSRNR